MTFTDGEKQVFAAAFVLHRDKRRVVILDRYQACKDHGLDPEYPYEELQSADREALIYAEQAVLSIRSASEWAKQCDGDLTSMVKDMVS